MRIYRQLLIPPSTTGRGNDTVEPLVHNQLPIMIPTMACVSDNHGQALEFGVRGVVGMRHPFERVLYRHRLNGATNVVKRVPNVAEYLGFLGHRKRPAVSVTNIHCRLATQDTRANHPLNSSEMA